MGKVRRNSQRGGISGSGGRVIVGMALLGGGCKMGFRKGEELG